MAERLEQLNLRVTRDAADLFHAAVFVRDLKSVQELLRPVLEAYAESLRNDDAIKAAVRLRQKQRSKSIDNVRELPVDSPKRNHTPE